MEINKSVEDTDIPVEILKEKKIWIFYWTNSLSIYYAILSSKFPASFIFANITPVLKEVPETKKMILDQLVFYR